MKYKTDATRPGDIESSPPCKQPDSPPDKRGIQSHRVNYLHNPHITRDAFQELFPRMGSPHERISPACDTPFKAVWGSLLKGGPLSLRLGGIDKEPVRWMVENICLQGGRMSESKPCICLAESALRRHCAMAALCKTQRPEERRPSNLSVMARGTPLILNRSKPPEIRRTKCSTFWGWKSTT